MTKTMITEQSEKIKSFFEVYQETIGVIFFMLCIGIGSFFFGRAYGQTEVQKGSNQGNIYIQNSQTVPTESLASEKFGTVTDLQNASNTPAENVLQGSGKYVASQSGTKYYPASGCGAVNRIKPENRVYFETAEAAESQGYERYSGCK